MIRPIAIGLSPNTGTKDALLALSLLLKPWEYKKNRGNHYLTDWFRNFFQVRFAADFTTGRGALFAILSCLGIGEGDEVILQAFTCAAVVQAIKTTGAEPIYVDIDKSMTMSVLSLEKHISKKTKAILVQHTFGIPAALDKIQKVAKKHKLFVIEDVAHTVGGTYHKKKLGTFGIASIFSFGRDKAFSSVNGGMAITNDSKLGEALMEFHAQQSVPSQWWIVQNLLHPILFTFFILPLYDVGKLGKGLLFILQQFHVLSLPVDKERVVLSKEETKRLPNAQALLAYKQLQALEIVNKKRQKIAKYYMKHLLHVEHPVQDMTIPFLRYPVFMQNATDYVKLLWEQHIYLGNWYANIIDPKGVSLSALGYRTGSCPQAEKIASKILNLPTYPTLTSEQLEKLVSVLNKNEQN